MKIMYTFAGRRILKLAVWGLGGVGLGLLVESPQARGAMNHVLLDPAVKKNVVSLGMSIYDALGPYISGVLVDAS